jgi:glyoxylate reductase
MKVLLTREILQPGLNILNIYSDRVNVEINSKPFSKENLLKAVKGVDALVVSTADKVTKEVIDAAGKNLKLIATNSIGYDHIDLSYANKKNIFIGNTPTNLTESVAEQAIALMLAVGRNIPRADTFCRTKNKNQWNVLDFLGTKFAGKTLGIIGLGSVGQHTARIAKYGFNMNILYTDVITQSEASTFLDAQKVSLQDLLENSDVILVSCRLYEDTKHLIGETELKMMKPLAYLINVARGPVINENALVTALKEGWIAGAGLDVFEEEPKITPALKLLNNVVMTPHIGSATLEVRIQMSRMTAENIVDVLINNKPPRYLVNKELVAETNSISSIS